MSYIFTTCQMGWKCGVPSPDRAPVSQRRASLIRGRGRDTQKFGCPLNELHLHDMPDGVEMGFAKDWRHSDKLLMVREGICPHNESAW